MQEHNFINMDGIGPEQLENTLYDMLGAEHHAVYDFDSYEYFWEFGCDVYNRLRDFMMIYKFDIKYSRKYYSNTLMGLPVRVIDEPMKRRCVRLLRINPRLTHTVSYINNLNKEGRTMNQNQLKRELNTRYGYTGGYTGALQMYIDTDIAATNVAYNQMYTIAMKRSIKNVIFNDPATIVFWNDGTKTVVKAEGEKFDPEKGLAMAIAKKYLGNQGNYYDVFKKWLPKDESEEQLLEKTDDANTEILTAKQLAEKTGQSVETVQRDCRRGLHPGAVKVDGKWLIPYSGLMCKMDNVDTRG